MHSYKSTTYEDNANTIVQQVDKIKLFVEYSNNQEIDLILKFNNINNLAKKLNMFINPILN